METDVCKDEYLETTPVGDIYGPEASTRREGGMGFVPWESTIDDASV